MKAKHRFSCDVDLDFVVAADRFDSPRFLETRLAETPETVRGLLRSVLRYLYETNGPTNLPPKRLKPVRPYLDPAEAILVRWLGTRTNGRHRAAYGKRALEAARRSRYRCEHCAFPDVRTLHLDHVDGRVATTAFACLCANCHNIKSRNSDWSGKPRYKK